MRSVFEAVQVEEMAFAMTLFVSAASGQISSGRKPLAVKNRKEGVELFLGVLSGPAGKRSLAEFDTLLESDLFRSFLIVWEHYRDDAVQASIGARLLGFYDLMVRTRGKVLEAWVEPFATTEEMVTLHPQVIETIASVVLTVEGRLDEERFLTELEKSGAAPGLRAEEMSQEGTWPAGTGEMARRIRELNWAGTPLGPIVDWPQSLRSFVDLALACRFPMIVLRGEELIQIYNDGYCDLMGEKHPEGLGQPTRECWPEVWHINEPIYARVWGGETVTVEDGLYPLNRHGRVEDAYFTLCYSALRGESGAVAGVLVTVFETTERVEAERKKAEVTTGSP